MAQPTIAGDPLLAWRGLTRVQYDAVVEAGLLDGEHIELLEGVLVEMVPQGDAHFSAVTELSWWLTRRLDDPWRVGVQGPLAVSATSEPEPDLAVTRRTSSGHPQTAELVIEVAYTSQRADLVHKPRLYAGADVTQYWVIDLPAREVVVHTQPGDGGYASVQRLPWTTPLSVLGIPVDLATLLADL